MCLEQQCKVKLSAAAAASDLHELCQRAGPPRWRELLLFMRGCVSITCNPTNDALG